MDQARWQQIERLYHAAPAADRAAFLVEACAGDVGLRREVEELLDAPPTADGVFAAPAVARAAAAAADEPSGGGGEVCCWTTRMLKVTVTP